MQQIAYEDAQAGVRVVKGCIQLQLKFQKVNRKQCTEGELLMSITCWPRYAVCTGACEVTSNLHTPEKLNAKL